MGPDLSVVPGLAWVDEEVMLRGRQCLGLLHDVPAVPVGAGRHGVRSSIPFNIARHSRDLGQYQGQVDLDGRAGGGIALPVEEGVPRLGVVNVEEN